jgi:voltage-gated potassium channel
MLRRVLDPKEPHLGPGYVARGIGLLAAILCFGTVGYMVIEKWDALDALYMTVITITTVGFGEIHPISEAGRIFTIILIFVGIGIVAYILGLVARTMVVFQMTKILGRRKLGLKKRAMKDHYIICGFGRIGKTITQELLSSKIPVLIIDMKEENKAHLEDSGIPYILDDATNEEVLMEARIDRARGLVSVVSSDADNLFITMTARGLNPDLFIITRTDDEKNQKKLERAGANRVFLPYVIGGQRMAHTIAKPAVTSFLDLTVHDKNIELKMEELQVREGSRLAGTNLLESGIRQDLNIIIVAIRKSEGEMIFNPSSQTRMEEGDTLIALGLIHDLEELKHILSGAGANQRNRFR